MAIPTGTILFSLGCPVCRCFALTPRMQTDRQTDRQGHIKTKCFGWTCSCSDRQTLDSPPSRWWWWEGHAGPCGGRRGSGRGLGQRARQTTGYPPSAPPLSSAVGLLPESLAPDDMQRITCVWVQVGAHIIHVHYTVERRGFESRPPREAILYSYKKNVLSWVSSSFAGKLSSERNVKFPHL